MAKTTQCEDAEVQAIIEAGTQSVEWVQQEFARADLRDKRLNRRLIKTAQQLATSPISPINEACGDWASTQAAYRLFDNPKASPQAILAPHIEETVERMAAQSSPVLVMQDTVFFSYGQHPKTKGLGALASAEVLGTLAVDIPGNGKRKARTAQVEVRMAQVTIKAPHRRGQAKASASMEPVSVKVIAATEGHPPEGAEAISWVLLTSLLVPDFDSAAEKIRWYGQRFGIETWHKVLKSGCKVEDCLLETAERLGRYLSLFSIIGVRLMHVAYLARAQPDLPATEVLCAEEIEALHVRLYKKRPPPEPPSLREVVRMIGRIGGHLGRKCDGEPGMTVMWRGWMRLYEDVLMLRACKQSFGLIDPG